MSLKSLEPVPLRVAASASRAGGAQSRRLGSDDGGEAGDADDGSGSETPLFLIKVGHGRGSGSYRLTVRLEPREDVREVFHRHRLTAIRVYTDTEREREIEAWQKELREEKRAGHAERPILSLRNNTTYFLSPEWVWATARQACAAYRHARVLRITVGDLMAGTTLTGSLEWLHGMERELLGKIDWLASRIAGGVAYDSEEMAVYAPGKARKATASDDGGTPPNEWRP